MPEYCPDCGLEINDLTEICTCGCNIRALRAERSLKQYKEGNEGYRTALATERARREQAEQIMKRMYYHLHTVWKRYRDIMEVNNRGVDDREHEGIMEDYTAYLAGKGDHD